jgi:hypothetical protein
MRRRALLALALACGACGAPVETQPAKSTMALGTIAADGSFAALTDGEDVTLVEGAQGGFHVWMKYRLEGVAPSHVAVLRTARRMSDDQLVLRSTGDADVGAGAAMWETPAATPMFMCPSPIGLSVVDQPIQFEIALTDDAGGAVASGTIALVPHCPVANADFCMRICTG